MSESETTSDKGRIARRVGKRSLWTVKGLTLFDSPFRSRHLKLFLFAFLLYRIDNATYINIIKRLNLLVILSSGVVGALIRYKRRCYLWTWTYSNLKLLIRPLLIICLFLSNNFFSNFSPRKYTKSSQNWFF